jgi:hypothetical protein
MTGTERRTVELLLEATVDGGELPPIAETDALAAFDDWLLAAPRTNRTAVRGMLRAVGAKLRRLDPTERATWLETGPGALGNAAQILARIAVHCYYGDDAVMRRLGYDAAQVAREGRALRVAEGRL